MKKLAIVMCVILFSSCQKDKETAVTPGTQTTATNNESKGVVAAKINDRQWKSAAKKTIDSNAFLAAINSGTLQIKTFGYFTDTSGLVSEDQLGIYIDGVTDTGTFALSMTNYIVYNQLMDNPLYYSTQKSNIGTVRISNLTDTSISGSFECTVESTSGTGSIIIREGTFSNVLFQ